MHRLLMDIMSNSQEASGGRFRLRRISGIKDVMHHILRDLVGFGGSVQVILGVKIKVRDMIAKVLHGDFAGSVAGREWWS